MNEDIYAEWLVKRKPYKWVPLAYIGAGILALLSVILMISFQYGFIAFIIVAFGIFVGRRYLSVEYEYTFVTNELTIDRIFSQAFRRTAINVQMSTVESIQKTDPAEKERMLLDRDVKYLDFTSHDEDEVTYRIIFDDEKMGHCFLEFEPNEKLLNALWRCSPTKVKI